MKILVLTFLLSINILPQYIPEPVYNEGIYEFLGNLSNKGIIMVDDNVKPFSRAFIASRLSELSEKQDELTELEREYLEFYISEYYYELNPEKKASEFVTEGESGRWRLFKYNDENFYAYLDPILGVEFDYNGDTFLRHRWNGAKAGGYVKKNWGYYLDFRDNEEHGIRRDPFKNFTPQTGIKLARNTKLAFEYSEVKGGVSYSWDIGSIGMQKEFLQWGSGRGGQLILSTKAPSFPFIRFELSPADWLDFIYIHGFLQSNIIDSSSIRNTLVAGRKSYYDIPKYIASHMVSFNILQNLRVSLGESIVYSDRIEPLYLIPVMFFRLADHYIAKKGSSTGGNAQLFADAYYKNHYLRTKFYSTLFIDELSLTSLLKGERLNAIGYTVGASAADPIIENSSLTLEYTRLNPFVYMNSNDVQLYTNHSYQLGHWIGSNADQIYISYSQKIIRGLELTLTGEYIRKGKKELPEEQYTLPYPEFLYGGRTSYKRISVKAEYEYMHDLVVRLEYENHGRNIFRAGVYYGL